MSIVAIHRNINSTIDDDLLERLGDIYVTRNIEEIKNNFGRLVDTTIFELPFEDFARHMNWVIYNKKPQKEFKKRLSHK